MMHLRRAVLVLVSSLFFVSTHAVAHPSPTRAIDAAGERIVAAPEDPGAWLDRAGLWLAIGEIESARADLDRASRLLAESGLIEPEILRRETILRARLALRSDDSDTAARLARRLLARGDDPAAWRLLAEAERRRGDLAAAVEALDRLLAATDRPSPDLVLDAVDLLVGLDRPVEALERLRAALDRIGPSPALVRRSDELAGTLGISSLPVPDPVPSPLPASIVPTKNERGTAPALVRGPYLQRATPDGVIVRWRTDGAVIGRVRYGVEGGPLDQVIDGASATTEHAVALLGLQPATRYAYRLESVDGTILTAAPDPVFRTPPADAASAGPTRVWVLGDSGTANADARAVRDAFLAWNGGPEADLLLLLGDNAYNFGTDAEYQAALFDTYPSVLAAMPVWPTLGNHDAENADSATQSGVYYDLFTLPTAGEAGGVPSGTEAYYSFDHGGVHFVCLDSHDSDRSPGSAMLTWLAADLAANDSEWTVAFWHHPPYTRGSHDSDLEVRLVEMRENVLPVLEAHGVDLVLSGHSHSYERSVLLHGHHGSSDTFDASMVIDGGDGDPVGSGAYVRTSSAAPGAVYAVAGSSGKISGGPLDHPVMTVSLSRLGSLVLDVDGPRLDVTFLDDTGIVVDTFRLERDVFLFADAFESGGLGAWSSSVAAAAPR